MKSDLEDRLRRLAPYAGDRCPVILAAAEVVAEMSAELDRTNAALAAIKEDTDGIE